MNIMKAKPGKVLDRLEKQRLERERLIYLERERHFANVVMTNINMTTPGGFVPSMKPFAMMMRSVLFVTGCSIGALAAAAFAVQ